VTEVARSPDPGRLHQRHLSLQPPDQLLGMRATLPPTAGHSRCIEFWGSTRSRHVAEPGKGSTTSATTAGMLAPQLQAAAGAQSALRAEDTGPAEEALALIIDLACEMKDRGYFRSEDPVEAARFVVSDAAAMLCETVRDRHGVQIFAERTAVQLIRWESRYGWTRGWGQVHEKETSLASVLARMLRIPDMWTVFADRYLDALDQIARAETARPTSRRSWEYRDVDYLRRQRASDLAEWHDLLLDRLAGSEAEDRLDWLVSHPALGGPELSLVQARLARQRGDLAGARKLAHDCLRDLPGHAGFALAGEIGADLPPRAQELAGQRSRWEAAGGVALVNAGQRLSDVAFPSTGTVAQAALLLCARIAGYLQRHRSRIELLPAATAAERLAEAARRIDAALPDRGRVADLLAVQPWPPETGAWRPGAAAGSGSAGRGGAADVAYPFLSDVWLRTELRKLIEDFGAGMAEKQAADPGRLLTQAVALLASLGLVARVDGGVLVLPLLARYRSITAHIKNPPPGTS
jgi:hypothetical protein